MSGNDHAAPVANKLPRIGIRHKGREADYAVQHQHECYLVEKLWIPFPPVVEFDVADDDSACNYCEALQHDLENQEVLEEYDCKGKQKSAQ